MGLTQKLGTIPLAILTDTSNNVGIGGSPSGSYKLEVTGTAKVSSTLLVSGAASFTGSLTSTRGNNTSLDLRSGNAAQYTIFGLGRTAQDLAIASSAASGQFFVGSVAGDGWIGATNGTIGFGNDTSGIATMVIKGGNVGIGETPTSSIGWARILTLNGNNVGDTAYILKKTGSAQEIAFGTDGASLYIDVTGAASASNNTIRFRTGQNNSSYGLTERVRITSTPAQGYGCILVNTTTVSDSYTIQTSSGNGGVAVKANGSGDAAYYSSSSAIGYHFYADNTSSAKIYILTNGDVKNVNNSYGAISDIKLKENIVDATPKLQDILKVRIRNYNLISDESKTKQIGVIAQELEEVFPSMITEDKTMESEETFKTVKYSVFVPMLIKAIQELSAQNQDLKSRLDKAGL